MEWKVRRLEARDEASFVPFLGRWISDRSIAEHFNWLYRGNPHGTAVTWIAVLNKSERIVGCTSIFPRLLRLESDLVLGACGGDSFVDPDFRRRGIAQSLYEYMEPDLRYSDILCHYGFTVPTNLRVMLRTGSLNICDFHQIWLPLNAQKLVSWLRLGPLAPFATTILNPAVKFYLSQKLFRKSPPRTQLQVVDAFDSKVDELFDSVTHRINICCVRDAAYLNWRFKDHPFKKYTIVKWQESGRLLAYAVLDLDTERCQILDFLVRDDDDIGYDFLASLAKFAIDKGKWLMVLELNTRGPGAKLFRQTGFKRLGKGHPFLVTTIDDTEKNKIVNDPDKWYLMPGDRDVG